MISSSKQTNHSSPAALFCAVFGRLGAAKHPHCCSCLTFPVLDISLAWESMMTAISALRLLHGCFQLRLPRPLFLAALLLPLTTPSFRVHSSSDPALCGERFWKALRTRPNPWWKFPCSWCAALSGAGCKPFPCFSASSDPMWQLRTSTRVKQLNIKANYLWCLCLSRQARPIPWKSGPWGMRSSGFFLVLDCTPRTRLSHARSHLVRLYCLIATAQQKK